MMDLGQPHPQAAKADILLSSTHLADKDNNSMYMCVYIYGH